MDKSGGMEEDQFFDSRDEITSLSDFGSDCSEDCSSSGLISYVSHGFSYELWNRSPESVQERRHRFLKWKGLNLDFQITEREEETRDWCFGEFEVDFDRIKNSSGAVLANSDFEDSHVSTRSSLSCRSNEAMVFVEDDAFKQNPRSEIQNSDDQVDFLSDKLPQEQVLRRLHEVSLNQTVPTEGLCSLPPCSLAQQSFSREVDSGSLMENKKKKMKKGWLQKLGVMTHIIDKQQRGEAKPSHMNKNMGSSIQRVHVHSYKKRSKELSALYAGQEFPAHEGSILTMKFSPDGQYLASSGEDGIVRVWKVVEDERPNMFSIQDIDPSCLYFSLNEFSKLVPLNLDKDKTDKVKKMRKSSESACVIFPSKVFHILEKPIHEFHGHSGEVLALSWSKKGCLLSSSVDKTVRLWQVGRDCCLGVFSHNNYVTCVEFNPVDDNYFISGSIDGKIRIWEVDDRRVVDWTDTREIVTALNYCPDGKGGIVGSMNGNCRFFDIIDGMLQLGAEICLPGKKKSPGKRVIGFQFSPIDPKRVIVTTADSQVRILCGVDIICKFKGTRSSGSHVSASFTSDGKHIISSAEDSNISIWNCSYQEKSSSRSENISSWESFMSHNALVAIPWCGMRTMPGMSGFPANPGNDGHFDKDLSHLMPSSSSDCFSMNLHKGVATWPEEELPQSSPVPVSPSMGRSEYKFLRSACQSTSSDMWGLVIVTAGCDGQIRTYLNYGLTVRL